MYKNYFRFIALFVFLLLFPFDIFSASSFKFAFFTDIHISQTSKEPAEDLQRAVDEVNHYKDLDFVIVSGDITQKGDSNSFAEAKRILQQLTIPFYIVAGNHDFNWLTTGPTLFKNVFGNDRFSFTHKGFRFIGFTTTPLNVQGNGFIMKQDVDWMASELKRTGTRMPVFVVTHYPLLTGDVDNWKDMTQLLRKFNIQALLGGHYHRNTFLNYDGIPGIIHRSTLRGKQAVGGYSILYVADTLTVSEKVIGQEEQEWLKLPLTPNRIKQKK